MSEHITQAKQARETLARALGALQSDPTVPPALMDVAEPVAQAMGALHGIERSGSLATAPEARDHVRAALGKLQAQSAINHPAINNAMESVAGSLGLIFGLVRAYDAEVTSPGTSAASLAASASFGGQPAAAAPVAAPAAAPAYAAPAQGYAPAPAAPAPAPAAETGGAAYAPTAAQGYAASPQGYGAPPQVQAPAAQPAPAVQPAAPGFQPAAAYQAHDAPAPTAFAPSAVAAPAAPPLAPAPAQVASQLAPGGATADPFAPVRPASVSGKAPPSPAGTPQRFEAALGISSATNFYKGLSGNDVIEHGGLFVATYNKVPPVGSPVALRVILPGGFEFESMATVVWTRDSAGGGGDQPGFGARFTQINAEAKQLVYRYVRNREPLFYDDL